MIKIAKTNDWAIVIIILILMVLLAKGIVPSSQGYTVPGISCENTQQCSTYVWECLAHDSPGYAWTGDIRCVNGRCVCISG